MRSALEQFRISIGRVRDLIAIHTSIKAQATPALDLSDILRAALVLTVSALDYYIHEVVALGMLDIYRGQRSEPPVSRNASLSAFARFSIPLDGARQERSIALNIVNWLENDIRQNQGFSSEERSYSLSELLSIIENGILARLNESAWLENEIRQKHSYQSFQQPDKIAEAIRLISDKKLWDEVGNELGKPANDIKQQLSNIVDRRNKIAHEADIDPSFSIGRRWPIDESLVSDAVNFIEQLVESIHKVITD
jgi:hypothetical protein